MNSIPKLHQKMLTSFFYFGVFLLNFSFTDVLDILTLPVFLCFNNQMVKYNTLSNTIGS